MTTPLLPDAERPAFEAWAAIDGYDLIRYDDDTDYVNVTTRWVCEAWTAGRRELLAQLAAQKTNII